MESAAKKIAVQQQSLDTLAKVFLNSRIALDYLLAKLAVCAMTNTTYYNWIDTFGDAETQLYKIND